MRRRAKLTNCCSIKPTNYDLSLFNLELSGGWGYDGLVKIDAEVKSSTDEVVLNTKHLEIMGVEVSGKDGGCRWHDLDPG